MHIMLPERVIARSTRYSIALIVSSYYHFGIYMYKLPDHNCTDIRAHVYALLGLRT